MLTSKELRLLPEKILLQQRICDLPVGLSERPIIQTRVKKIKSELKSKGLRFSPNVWVSDDWFSPDGHPGFAIPFTLMHRRLINLERKHVGFIEGACERNFLQLLRHETGHAIDNAFYLRKNKRRQKLFGLTQKKYPDTYRPNLYSKDYVHHLNDHYAQSHPDEDWAETFAVWLTPRSNWKKKYYGTRAYQKLLLVNELMVNLQDLKPPVQHMRKVDHYKSMKGTLGDYFAEKRKKERFQKVSFLEKDLKTIFAIRASRSNKSASRFLHENKKEMIKSIAQESNHTEYTINGVYEEVIDLCRQKGLKLRTTDKKTHQLFRKALSRKAKGYLNHPKFNKVLM